MAPQEPLLSSVRNRSTGHLRRQRSARGAEERPTKTVGRHLRVLHSPVSLHPRAQRGSRYRPVELLRRAYGRTGREVRRTEDSNTGLAAEAPGQVPQAVLLLQLGAGDPRSRLEHAPPGPALRPRPCCNVTVYPFRSSNPSAADPRSGQPAPESVHVLEDRHQAESLGPGAGACSTLPPVVAAARRRKTERLGADDDEIGEFGNGDSVDKRTGGCPAQGTDRRGDGAPHGRGACRPAG